MISLHILVILLLSDIFIDANEEDEARASDFHDNVYEPKHREWSRKLNLASWEYETNMTDENLEHMKGVSFEMKTFVKDSWKIFTSYDWRNFQNETLKRLFYLNSQLGTAALSDDKIKKLTGLVDEMTSQFSKTIVCDYKNRQHCSLNLDPDVLDILGKSRNYYELLFIWKEWHDKCGRPIRTFYDEYVSLSNEVARLNGFKNAAEQWIDDYESPTFEDDMESIWLQIKPYYEELHAFVRRRLMGVYGDRFVKPDAPIPAHILGDAWGQLWTGIYDLVVPFSDKPNLDITKALQQQEYNVTRMFELSDSFYQSLGLLGAPEPFWKNSMVIKPTDREVVCHPTAWQIDGEDVRIAMCTHITMDDLFNIHHEMGHIQYYLQFSHLPTTFQDAANPGFHESIGDTIVLSVSTPKHLQSIGLLSDFNDDEEFELNHLMLKALERLASLPFAYLIDKWRWKVFRGEITPENYNTKWWELSKLYQGIEPAIKRTEIEFDPGTKMHVASNDAFISYFVSTILQFQFHEAMCREIGQFDPKDPQKPLHKCNIFGSKEAGTKFGNMLKQGASRPWQDTLEEFTGSRQIDTSSMLNFFAPLYRYLQKVNRLNNEHIGWDNKRRQDGSHSKALFGLPKKRRRGGNRRYNVELYKRIKG